MNRTKGNDEPQNFRPLIRPNLAAALFVKAADISMDRTQLVNIYIELALAGNLVMEIETAKTKIKVADNAYLTNTAPMRKEIL
jgi:hypothetical protein